MHVHSREKITIVSCRSMYVVDNKRKKIFIYYPLPATTQAILSIARDLRLDDKLSKVLKVGYSLEVSYSCIRCRRAADTGVIIAMQIYYMIHEKKLEGEVGDDVISRFREFMRITVEYSNGLIPAGFRQRYWDFTRLETCAVHWSRQTENLQVRKNLFRG